MVFFTSIRPSDHYRNYHESEIPWHIVIEIITTTKNPRKKGSKFEIERDGYYILFEIKAKTLWVINAKRT